MLPTMPHDVIYDFGMNNGDDVEYYLMKGPRVVGVEANPVLCAEVARRFPEHIKNGDLVILNFALSADDDGKLLTFYVHKTNHVLSQLPRPADDALPHFEQIRVPSRTASSIVAEHGEPSYIKIDVEHFDLVVLKELFAAGILPPEISAESHSADIFAELVAAGYRSFNLVEGRTVSSVYGSATISTSTGSTTFAFKPHSAGPFGIDLNTPWEDVDTFFYTLAAAGLGWKDIHASRTIPPGPPPSPQTMAMRQGMGLMRKVLAGLSRRIFPG